MVKTYPWDPADYLETDEDMAGYLDAALEQDDHRVTALVLSDVARAKGMERAARGAGLDQESLDRANIRGDKLDFAAFMDMSGALGIRLYAGAAKTRRSPPPQNGKLTEDLVSRLNTALDQCDARGAALALRDIAEANGIEHIAPDAWTNEVPNFAIFMDAARALGLRIHAAVARARDADSRERREAAAKSS